ncbi:hypothetical protein Tco_0305292 [Tanacetum coccineum]
MHGIKKCHGWKKNHFWMKELRRNLMMIYVIIKEEEESSEDAWSNYSPNNDNNAIQANQERFDNHEDDDIMDLEDYLIRQDASYYIDEEEERLKERKRKLLWMPYEKPPTFKYEKFESLSSQDVDTAYPIPWIRCGFVAWLVFILLVKIIYNYALAYVELPSLGPSFVEHQESAGHGLGRSFVVLLPFLEYWDQ